MAEIKYIPDHSDRAQERKTTGFRGSDNMVALLEAIGEGAQALEDELFDILISTYLSTARGDQLDQWGATVGEPRQGLSDDEYRVFIQGRILVNLSDGTPPDLIEIYQTLTAPSVVRLWELHPHAFHLTAYRQTFMAQNIRRRIRRMMTDAKPAGHEMVLTESPWDALDTDDESTLQPGGFARLL